MLCFFSFSILTVVGQDKALVAVDNGVESLLNIVDENKYTYDHQLWLEAAQKAFSDADRSVVDTMHFVNLKRIIIDRANAMVFYYLRPMGPRMEVNWIVRRTNNVSHAEQTCSLSDVVSLPVKPKAANGEMPLANLDLRLASYREMLGLELADTITGERVWWMPDINIRMDMETMADVNSSSEAKDEAERVVRSRVSDLLSSNDALTDDFSGLPRLFSVVSNDKKVRIVTYMNTYDDLSSHCGGFVLHRCANGYIDKFELNDVSETIKSPEKSKGTSDKWYGAVYYNMVEATFDKQTYYTLLGYKGNDGMVKTRVLDAMWFDGKKCRFGASIFEHEKASYTRRVFRYSSGVNMMMRWDEKRKSIVFDHLSPERQMYIGEYHFYGPDFSYDCYVKTGKFWQFNEDIELRNE